MAAHQVQLHHLRPSRPYPNPNPNPGNPPLFAGWITVLKSASRVGQIKVVCRGPNDCAVSYINVLLTSPQLLHCRMITYCEVPYIRHSIGWVAASSGRPRAPFLHRCRASGLTPNPTVVLPMPLSAVLLLARHSCRLR